MLAEEEPPSTARRPNVVNAPGGVALGRSPPGFGKSPGRVPSRQIPPPGHQGSMCQEEERHPQEEGILAAIQAAAVHLQAQRLRSSQEGQTIQVAARQPRLQDYLHRADILIHGRP